MSKKRMLSFQLRQRMDDFLISSEDILELHPNRYDKTAQQVAKCLESIIKYRGEKRASVCCNGERVYLIKHRNAEPPKECSRVPYGIYPLLFNAFIESGFHQKCVDWEVFQNMSKRKLSLILRARIRENAKYQNIGVREIDGKIHLIRKDKSPCA